MLSAHGCLSSGWRGRGGREGVPGVGGMQGHLLPQNLYESIKNEPFKIPEDDGNDLTHTFFNPDREGWLLKLGEWSLWAGAAHGDLEREGVRALWDRGHLRKVHSLRPPPHSLSGRDGPGQSSEYLVVLPSRPLTHREGGQQCPSFHLPPHTRVSGSCSPARHHLLHPPPRAACMATLAALAAARPTAPSSFSGPGAPASFPTRISHVNHFAHSEKSENYSSSLCLPRACAAEIASCPAPEVMGPPKGKGSVGGSV